MADELDKLAVGIAADHTEKKRRGKGAAAQAGDQAAQDATDAGSPADEAQALGQVVEEGAAAAVEQVEGAGEMREAVAALGEAVEERGDDDRHIVAERIEGIAAIAQLDTSTLVGDLTAVLLDLFKTRAKPWSAMLEADQRIVALALRHAAQDLVSSAVELVAEYGDGAFEAKLDGYANKGAFKIALTAEATRDISNALFDCEGQMVTVRRYDPKPFSGTRREPAIEPDQRPLEFETAKPDDDAPAEETAAEIDADQAVDADLADGFDDDRDPE